MPVTVKIYASEDVEDEAAEIAARALEKHFGARTHRAGSVPLPAWAFDKHRGQYDASALLAQVPVPGPGELALAIVGQDMYVRGLNFVFGLASGRRAIISLARLRDPENPARERHRIATEAVHEVGHLLGLGHCRNPRCAMFFSNTLSDTDAKGPALCAHCRDLAEKALAAF